MQKSNLGTFQKYNVVNQAEMQLWIHNSEEILHRLRPNAENKLEAFHMVY